MNETNRIDSKNVHLLFGLPELIERCHGASVAAGWYANTGVGYEERDGKFANVGEKICLIHSEISEAMEGARKNLLDTHLPHRLMIEVELADTVIRIADLLGFLEVKPIGAYVFSLNTGEPSANIGEALADIHRSVSLSESNYLSLVVAVVGIVKLANRLDLDLPAAIDEKLAYNLRRADHKREARAAVGGKAF